MAFAGTEAPAAYGELISIGGLGPSVNGKLSSTLADILQTKLSIDSSRFYIKFYDVQVFLLYFYSFHSRVLMGYFALLEKIIKKKEKWCFWNIVVEISQFLKCIGSIKRKAGLCFCQIGFHIQMNLVIMRLFLFLKRKNFCLINCWCFC